MKPETLRPRRILAILLAAVSLAGCFGTPEDTDLLPKDGELEGWQVTARTPEGTLSWHVTSDPTLEDTDGDGLDDFLESLERLDPRNPDTDGDGLLDGHDLAMAEADARVRIFRDLGIREGNATGGAWFLGEAGTETVSPGGDPLDWDTDGDGLGDGYEAAGFEVIINGVSRTVTTHVRFADTDGDRLEDGFELEHGLDPSDPDTDGDGVPDGVDVDPWHDIFVDVQVDDFQMTSASSRYVMDIQSLSSETWTGPLWDLADDTDDFPFTSGPITTEDTGGDVLSNRSLVHFFVRLHASTDRGLAPADAMSDLTGSAQLFGTLDARTEEAFYDDIDGTRHPWPIDGRFSGPDGSWVVHLGPVRP